MKKFVLTYVLLLMAFVAVYAQRQTMTLGRGVVATFRDGVTITWRRLAQEPENARYNVYVDKNGGTNYTKINSEPLQLTNYRTSTSIVPSGSTITVTLVDEEGREGEKSVPFKYVKDDWGCVAFKVNFAEAGSPITTAQNFFPKFCWPVDLNGDGEMEYVVCREYNAKDQNGYEGYGEDKLGGDCLEAYTREGRHLWTVNLGVHYFAFGGQNDGVTVGDFDGDGKGEVMVQVCEGARFWDSSAKTFGKYLYYNGQQQSSDGKGIQTVSSDGSNPDIDNDGIVNYTWRSAGKNPQYYMVVIDGMKGTQKDVCAMTLPTDSQIVYTRVNKTTFMGDEYSYLSPEMGSAFLDGIHQSAVAQFQCRLASGEHHYFTYAYGYEGREFHEIFRFPFWDNGKPSEFHHIRIGDVDGDGKDEVMNGAYALDHDGKVLWNAGISHGDRFRLSDIDPDTPGQEIFAIQQNAPDMLGQILYSATDGKPLKRWYMGSVGDVGRGECIDIDPTHKGYEMWSTMPNMYNAKGEMISNQHPFPYEGLWWDDNLGRESLWQNGDTDHNVVIGTASVGSTSYSRMLEISKASGWKAHGTTGGRPMFFGDILGDWREEVILVTNDDAKNYDGFVCYTTNYSTTENRIYCLLEDANYFGQITNRGYYQSPCTGFYLGYDMPRPPLPQVIKQNSETALYDLTLGNATVSAPAADVKDAYYMPVKGQTLTMNSAINGDVTLWKGMQGTLVVNADLTTTGKIVVSEGTLDVNGSVKGTVELRARGILAGTGVINKVELEGSLNYAEGVIRPTKTITIGSDFTVNVPSYVEIDVDRQALLKIQGNLAITDTLIFVIDATELKKGEYTLIEYSGEFLGDLKKCGVRGVVGLAYSIVNEGGAVKLVVSGARDALTGVEWEGGESSVWDYQTKNWSVNGQPSTYVTGDAVVFGDKTTKTTITLNELMTPSQVEVNASQNYTFQGNGGFSGKASLTKNGLGTLTLDCKNSDYTGATIINEGKVVLKELSMGGSASSIGVGTTGYESWKCGKATMKFDGSSMATDRGITLTDTATFEVPKSCSTTIKGRIYGADGILRKTGDGQLSLSYSTSNYYKSTILDGGTIALGTVGASIGMGTAGSLVHVTGDSKIIQFYSTSYDGSTSFLNALEIDSAKTLTFVGTGRGAIKSSVSGKGTISLSSRYVRFDNYMTGKDLEGTLSLAEGAGRFAQAMNMPKATLDIQSGATVSGVKAGSGTAASYTHYFGTISGAGTLGQGTWNIGGKKEYSKFSGVVADNAVLNVVGDCCVEFSGTCSSTINMKGGEMIVKSNSGKFTGKVTVGNGALLSGSSGHVGSVVVNKGGTIGGGSLNPLAPYSERSVSKILYIDGPLELTSGILRVRYSNTSFDKVSCTGAVTLNSPTFLFEPIITAIGVDIDTLRTFKIFPGKGTITINGDVTFMPKRPRAGYKWDTSTLASDGTIRIEKEEILFGDANDDGVVSVADLSMIASYILGERPFDFYEYAADVNQDGTITVADLSKIAVKILAAE